MSIPISVLMPVYNGSNYMKETINRVLNQSMKDFEFIIANDGSIDNTSEIIHSYANIDSRIVVIDRKYNMGLADTLNQLFSVARGKYIVFTAHDDLIPDNTLDEVYNFFQKNPDVSVCGTQFIQIFGTENRLKEYPSDHNVMKYIHTPFIGMGSALNYFRREVLEKFSFRPKYGPAMDMDLLARILMESNIKFGAIPKTLQYFRKHDSNYGKNTFDVIRHQMLIQLKLLSNIYKSPVDPVISYAISNISNLDRDTLLQTKNAIFEISNHLDNNYSEKMGIGLGNMWKNRCRFLLEAS